MFGKIRDDLEKKKMDPQDPKQVEDFVGRTEESYRSELSLPYRVIRQKKGHHHAVVGSSTVKAVNLGWTATNSPTLSEHLRVLYPDGVQGHCFLEPPSEQPQTLSAERGRLLLYQLANPPHPLPTGWLKSSPLRGVIIRFGRSIWERLPPLLRRHMQSQHPSRSENAAANNFALAYEAYVCKEAGDSGPRELLAQGWDKSTVEFYDNFIAHELELLILGIA